MQISLVNIRENSRLRVFCLRFMLWLSCVLGVDLVGFNRLALKPSYK